MGVRLFGFRGGKRLYLIEEDGGRCEKGARGREFPANWAVGAGDEGTWAASTPQPTPRSCFGNVHE